MRDRCRPSLALLVISGLEICTAEDLELGPTSPAQGWAEGKPAPETSPQRFLKAPAQDLTQTQMPLDLLRRCWGFPDKGSALGERQFWPSEQQGDMGRQGSRVGSAAEGSSIQRRLQEKGEWRSEKPWLPEEGSRSPVKPGSEALRAGRSHEGHRGRLWVAALHSMGHTVGFFNTFQQILRL